MKTLLVPTDFSDASRNSSLYAVELAKALHAKVILLNVYPYLIPTVDSAIMITDEELENHSVEKLQEEKLWLSQKHELEIETMSLQGKPVETILSVAKKEKASWIIAGMKGSSRIARQIFGGTSFLLSKQSHVPVILVPGNCNFIFPKTIALASDVTDDTNIHVFDPLKEFCETFNATMYVVRVIKKGMNEVYERLMRPTIFKWHLKEIHPSYEFLNDNDVAHAMHNFTIEHKADIVAMICQEHTLFDNIFHKSNIKEMILQTQVPIIILPGKLYIENTPQVQSVKVVI